MRWRVIPALLTVALATGLVWSQYELAQRDARIAELQGRLRAAVEAQDMLRASLAAYRAAGQAPAAAAPAAAPAADPAPGPAVAAAAGAPTITAAATPMELGAAIKSFQATQPAPGSAGLSPFNAGR